MGHNKKMNKRKTKEKNRYKSQHAETMKIDYIDTTNITSAQIIFNFRFAP